MVNERASQWLSDVLVTPKYLPDSCQRLQHLCLFAWGDCQSRAQYWAGQRSVGLEQAQMAAFVVFPAAECESVS